MTEASIIIRTFNEQKHLPLLLEAISIQTYRDFEIVVVDSGSFDLTCEIAQRRADKLLRINSDDFTFGYSLNVGVDAAQGTYIAIVSAHALPVDSLWLENLVYALQDDSIAMAYGRQVGTATSKFAEAQDFRYTYSVEQKILRPPNFFANNANSAIRRDLWVKHPFDETLPGLEDIEWVKYWMEQGYQVVYEPSAAVYHIHEETWRQVRHRYFVEAVAAQWIGVKKRHNIPMQAWHELKNLATDLIRAGFERCLADKFGEIARFRFEKLVGTVSGILHGTKMDNPLARREMFFKAKSEAVVIHGPNRASLEKVDIPPVKPGDVLIKVAYEGICATDIEIFEGTLGYYKTGISKYPIIPGHEFSGRAMKIGSKVAHLRDGDAVIVECIQGCGKCAHCQKGNAIACPERQEVGVIGLNGGYSQYVVIPGRFIHRLPDNVDLRQATLCEPIAVVLKGLKRLEHAWGLKERKKCAVVGAGPIGHLSAQILALRGHQVTVFDRNPLRCSYFEGSQITTSKELENLAEFDTVVEATGDPIALDAILHNAAAGMTILLLGLPYARREVSFENIVAYDMTIVGSVGSSTQEFDEAIELLPSLNMTPFVENVLPLDKYLSAWKLSQTRTHLKVMLEIDPLLNEMPRGGQPASIQ